MANKSGFLATAIFSTKFREYHKDFNEKIICYYLGRIRPSGMRNRFNSIRYKESDSVSWYTSSFYFCSKFREKYIPFYGERGKMSFGRF